MALDSSTGEDWLFGTTRSIKRGDSGTKTYIWKLKLDPVTHDPDPNTVACFKTTDGIKSDGFVSGIRPILDGGLLHLTYEKDDQDFFYFIFDWTNQDQKSVEIHPKMLEAGEIRTVFVGNRRQLTASGASLNRWQGYIAGSKQDF